MILTSLHSTTRPRHTPQYIRARRDHAPEEGQTAHQDKTTSHVEAHQSQAGSHTGRKPDSAPGGSHITHQWKAKPHTRGRPNHTLGRDHNIHQGKPDHTKSGHTAHQEKATSQHRTTHHSLSHVSYCARPRPPTKLMTLRYCFSMIYSR